MDGLFLRTVTGTALQRQCPQEVNTAAYTILCAQAPDAVDRIHLLLTRLSTSTETSAAQNVAYVLATCVTTSLCPDTVEEMVETVMQTAKLHPNWADFLKWVCALVHYYCTDEFTVSLFAEFEAPQMATRALRDFPQHQQLVLAASVLLSHFNLYSMGDAVAQHVKVLQIHSGDVLTAKTLMRNLAEFTAYCDKTPERFARASDEFVSAGGVMAMEGMLHDHMSDEEMVTYAAHALANVLSANVDNRVDADTRAVMYLAEALTRYRKAEGLCVSILRVLGRLPRSRYIDWEEVASLLEHIESAALVRQAVRFLNEVATTVKELKPKLHALGCVAQVLSFMRLFPEDADIQEEACSLLSYMSYDSEIITSDATKLGGITLVLDAMHNHSSHEGVLAAACAALSGLTFNNVAGQHIIRESHAVTTILDAMHNGKRAKLQENGCLVIGTMCWNNDLKAEVVQCGGTKVVARALEQYYTNPGVVKSACRALAQIVFNSEQCRAELNAEGVIPLIIKGMEYHWNYDRAQMHGCVVLSYLCWTNDNNAAQIVANNGYKTIVDAMRNHASSYEVQEHACRALANISRAPAKYSVAAIEQIAAAMRRHERACEVQEEACRAIVTLSLASAVNKDRLHEVGAADAVITALKNFPRTQLLQQEACNALAHLAYEHAALNHEVTKLGGVALLLAAMRSHRQSSKVQLNACAGLSALAFDNTTAQKQIYELGGIECVIYAMRHFERLRMLELGCSVLGTLAWNTDIKEKVAVEAVPEILEVMRVHDGSPLLQKSTCRAIAQFAFNSEKNRRLLTEQGAIPLIVCAMRAHVTTEKLVTHALKALTYMCWENRQVAEAIVCENIEEVLQSVVMHYANTQRVYNEAVHLCKILFRKTTGSPSTGTSTMSPPFYSPVPFTQTPGPRRIADDRVPLSPPIRGTSSYRVAPATSTTSYVNNSGSDNNNIAPLYRSTFGAQLHSRLQAGYADCSDRAAYRQGARDDGDEQSARAQSPSSQHRSLQEDSSVKSACPTAVAFLPDMRASSAAYDVCDGDNEAGNSC